MAPTVISEKIRGISFHRFISSGGAVEKKYILPNSSAFETSLVNIPPISAPIAQGTSA